MQALDYIKQLLRKQALLACCKASDSTTSQPAELPGKAAGDCSRKPFSSRYQCWTPPENVISLGAARAGKDSTVGERCGDVGLNTGAENGQLQDNILTSIVELLRPVDWASVHTLARHTGVSHDVIEGHIEELQRRGVVDIGERLIPPDWRTVAWLTEQERLIQEQA